MKVALLHPGLTETGTKNVNEFYSNPRRSAKLILIKPVSERKLCYTFAVLFLFCKLMNAESHNTTKTEKDGKADEGNHDEGNHVSARNAGSNLHS